MTDHQDARERPSLSDVDPQAFHVAALKMLEAIDALSKRYVSGVEGWRVERVAFEPDSVLIDIRSAHARFSRRFAYVEMSLSRLTGVDYADAIARSLTSAGDAP